MASKYIVRLFDYFDNYWIDITGPVSKEEADRIWNEKTSNGTKMKSYDDMDYYRIFPIDTTMMLREPLRRGE